MALMDSTHDTNKWGYKYALCCCFLVVRKTQEFVCRLFTLKLRTQWGKWVPAAQFLITREIGPWVEEALRAIIDLVPSWQPRYSVTAFCLFPYSLTEVTSQVLRCRRLGGGTERH